jgi:preprotein translocase subunit SecA
LLQQALLDEADSILLDEANVPFIVSLPGAAPQRSTLEAARTLARCLRAGDYVLHRPSRSAQLTDSGRSTVTQAVPPSSPLWPARRAVELVRAALAAEHVLVRDRDYTVREDKIALIDETTGRLAEGRQWNHPLHAMVELKEGLEPSAPLRTAARITYQRLFPRYERLGGMSGTLKESAGELASLYRCRVVAVARARPSQARWLGRRCFATRHARLAACIQRARTESQARRPVLIGTDSVETSLEVSRGLAALGLEHQVLNAVQDAHEAQQVACAGQAGRITVTTNMAGRGTDIRLDAAAHRAGGLHVILALSNRSRRIDRQLAGRSARQGDPGSAEALICLEDGSMAQALPVGLRRLLARWADAQGELPAPLAMVLSQWSQRLAEWRERMHRRELRITDEQLARQLGFAGRQE